MKVSVLMPTYNSVDMLPKAIESFLNQDYDNATLFILNNGKKDQLLQVVYAGWITNGQTYEATAGDLERITREEYINYLTLMWRIPEVDGTLDNELRYYHDWLWKIQAYKKYKVGFIKEPVIDYAIHLGQASIECRKLGMNGIEEQLMRKKLKDKYGI